MITWLLVQTKPMQERKAATNVARMGYDYFLPELFDEKRNRVVPLFATYMFVKTKGHWGGLANAYGVSKVVMFGDKPAIVDKKVIAALRKMRNKSGKRRWLIELPKKQFKPGEHVKVTKGAFASTHGLCEGMTNDERVVVLFNLLGKPVRVKFDPSFIDKAA